MAEKKKRSKVKIQTYRPTLASQALNLTDLGHAIVEEYNSYIGATEELPVLTGDELAEMLDRLFSPSDIDYLMHTDYGRGVMAGAVAVLYSLEATLEPKVDHIDEDDPDLDEVSDILREHIRAAGKKGGRDGGETTQ